MKTDFSKALLTGGPEGFLKGWVPNGCVNSSAYIVNEVEEASSFWLDLLMA